MYVLYYHTCMCYIMYVLYYNYVIIMHLKDYPAVHSLQHFAIITDMM